MLLAPPHLNTDDEGDVSAGCWKNTSIASPWAPGPRNYIFTDMWAAFCRRRQSDFDGIRERTNHSRGRPVSLSLDTVHIGVKCGLMMLKGIVQWKMHSPSCRCKPCMPTSVEDKRWYIEECSSCSVPHNENVMSLSRSKKGQKCTLKYNSWTKPYSNFVLRPNQN